MEPKIAFKFTHNQIPYRFVLPSRGPNLLSRMMALVHDVTCVPDWEQTIYWNDGDSFHTIISDDDMAHAIQFTEVEAMNRDQPPCLHIRFKHQLPKKPIGPTVSVIHLAKKQLARIEAIKESPPMIERMLLAAESTGQVAERNAILNRVQWKLYDMVRSLDGKQEKQIKFIDALSTVIDMAEGKKSRALFGTEEGEKLIEKTESYLVHLIRDETRKTISNCPIKSVLPEIEDPKAERDVEPTEDTNVEDATTTGHVDSNDEGKALFGTEEGEQFIESAESLLRELISDETSRIILPKNDDHEEEEDNDATAETDVDADKHKEAEDQSTNRVVESNDRREVSNDTNLEVSSARDTLAHVEYQDERYYQQILAEKQEAEITAHIVSNSDYGGARDEVPKVGEEILRMSGSEKFGMPSLQTVSKCFISAAIRKINTIRRPTPPVMAAYGNTQHINWNSENYKAEMEGYEAKIIHIKRHFGNVLAYCLRGKGNDIKSREDILKGVADVCHCIVMKTRYSDPAKSLDILVEVIANAIIPEIGLSDGVHPTFVDFKDAFLNAVTDTNPQGTLFIQVLKRYSEILHSRGNMTSFHEGLRSVMTDCGEITKHLHYSKLHQALKETTTDFGQDLYTILRKAYEQY